MAKYKYSAIDAKKKRVKAVVDARDESDLRKILRERNLIPVKFSIVAEKDSGYRLKPDEVSDFCRQLSSMLASGITGLRALEILKERDFKSGLKQVYEKLHFDVGRGHTISEAMLFQPRAFPELLTNMFASGEAGGHLEDVTEKMATHYEKEHKLNGKIKSASRYPMILGVATLLVMLAIFLLVLPKFFAVLEGFELPMITRIVISISNFLKDNWYFLIIGVFVFIVVIRYILSIPRVRLKYDGLKLRLPAIGKLLKIIYTARFARTLSSLYSSGITMLHALEITGTIITNKYIGNQFTQLIKDVRNGESLSDAIRKIDGFDNKLPNTILIGEESGRLDTMLISTADSFDYEAEQATTAIVSFMEPVMVIVIAMVILVVILSVMLPMMTLYGSLGA